jgi:hypothetical protein
VWMVLALRGFARRGMCGRRMGRQRQSPCIM